MYRTPQAPSTACLTLVDQAKRVIRLPDKKWLLASARPEGVQRYEEGPVLSTHCNLA